MPVDGLAYIPLSRRGAIPASEHRSSDSVPVFHERGDRVSLRNRGKASLPNIGNALKSSKRTSNKRRTQIISAGRSDVITKQSKIVQTVQYRNAHTSGDVARRYKHLDADKLFSPMISDDPKIFEPAKGELLIHAKVRMEGRSIGMPFLTPDCHPFTSVNGLPKGDYFVNGVVEFCPDLVSNKDTAGFGAAGFSGSETILNTGGEVMCFGDSVYADLNPFVIMSGGREINGIAYKGMHPDKRLPQTRPFHHDIVQSFVRQIEECLKAIAFDHKTTFLKVYRAELDRDMNLPSYIPLYHYAGLFAACHAVSQNMIHGDERHGPTIDVLNALLAEVQSYLTNCSALAAKYDRSARSVSLHDSKKGYKALKEKPLVTTLQVRSADGYVNPEVVKACEVWKEYAFDCMKVLISEQWDWLRAMKVGTAMTSAASGQQFDIILKK